MGPGAAGRIVLLVTSPRLPAGLLTARAWDLVRAHPVFATGDDEPVPALRAAGVAVLVTPDAVADAIGAATGGEVVVLVAGPGGEADLPGEPRGFDLEVVLGSWDPPGARLLDAVAVIDRLASPGGDPWKLQQTHQSLARFLLEEAYEAYDAIVADDHVALREELGDVLLQVLLHARLAENLPEGTRYTVDEVAGDLVDKLVRRNPHVFGDARVEDVDEITEQWERIKKAEKARESVLDGVSRSQPALALAEKILSRADRAGLADRLPVPPTGAAGPGTDDLGARLFTIVAEARRQGLDAEASLRRAALAYAEEVRAAERSG